MEPRGAISRAEVEAFVEALEDVQRTENFGYSFFFVGDDHRLPFMTTVDSDNEYDSVSDLDREGVFRVNIGVSRETFESLLEDPDPGNMDYSALDVFMPHPDYAKQDFVCILSPSRKRKETVEGVISEAHSIAASRLRRGKSS